MAPALILAVLAVIFVAMLLRAVFGFGDAMFAIPLLAALIGLERGAPVLALAGTGLSLLMLRERPALIERGTVLRLLLGGVAGIPLGLYVIVDLPEAWAHRGLGTMLIGFAGLRLARAGRTKTPRPPSLITPPAASSQLDPPQRSEPAEPASEPSEPASEPSESPAPSPDSEAPPPPPGLLGWLRDLLFGALTGTTSAAFDIAGPPLLAYSAVRGWSSERLRINFQAFFLPLGVITIAGHGLAGLWTAEVLLLAALAVPVMLLGWWLGPRIRARIGEHAGQRLLLVIIFGLGVFEIASSL
nr:TSUP family transporter [Pseudenhygromyxa sp. WMMC2535]